MDRALGSGISIPQWMKGKGVSGFDPSTLSPPTYDDDFFQIRYNEPRQEPIPAGYHKLDDVLKTNAHSRPHGVDDGFHGSKSTCASTVVSAAHRILRAQPPPVNHPRFRERRNSKSLPASPLGSPETRRRLGNRFFTLEEPNKDTSGSSSSILEALRREQDSSAYNSSQDLQKISEIVRPQPSELREMNFWSPTSM